ncbi:MAG TPA: hypothetical protein VEG30_08455 [Terriglobales bacterium]|nr:hypothetical protein [Terriglobales bacterium]
MIPELRQHFNANYTPEKYQNFIRQLNQECGTKVEFRVSETPCFFPKPLLDKMARYGDELVHQLVDSPEYRSKSEASIPAAFRVPNDDAHPLFVQVDFGLIRDAAGQLQPWLVELQAFPSLYAYQQVVSRQYIQCYGLSSELKVFFGMDDEGYWALLRRSIVGNHDPKQVVLLEIDPLHQKTLPDFLVTGRICGIRTVNITEVVKQGDRLHYRDNGKLVPIQRIYNRTIVDELVRKHVQLPFDYRDEMDVEWAGHPNWYFRISKFSIPYLRHKCVPKTWFLDRLEQVPQDRENYVLKPVYSFAGAGIVFAPTDADLQAIPHSLRSQYILQEKMNFTPVIDTPHGPTQAEVRIMYIWLDRLLPVMGLVRMGRGKMMGVDHNRNLEWVGGSAALYVD